VKRRAAEAVRFSVADSVRWVELKTSELTCRIDKAPIHLSYHRPDGRLILSETEDGGTRARGRRRTAAFRFPRPLHFYGTGERGLGIDLRGRRLGLYNTPAYGYDGPVENMKFSVPFLATSADFALYFDVTHPASFDLGRSDPGRFHFEVDGEPMSYFFIKASGVAAQLELYTWLTGRQPMPPRWALGYIQSKYGYHSRREVEDLAKSFRRRGIPCDAIILDLYWFQHMGDLRWDLGAFPDPAGMIGDLAERGFHTVAITEPYFVRPSRHFRFLTGRGRHLIGRNEWGEPYHLRNWWTCGCDAVLFDITHPEAPDWLWSQHQSFMAMGLAGLWTDLGEPERHPWDMHHYAGSAREVHNTYNLLWARALYEGFSRYRPRSRFFNLTRSGYAGIQRYGVFTWSGDVSRTFGGLAVQVPIMLNAGLSGLAYHSSDLGGFTGRGTDELFTRWLQFGAFNPVMRAHGYENQGTEPWAHGDEVESIVADFIDLRYRLLPYIYTLAWENHRRGMPLARPLFFADPSDPNLSDYSGAFLLGPDILVVPVVEEGARNVAVYLPQGSWVDLWTDAAIEGGRRVTVPAPLERIPVFVRAGAILPMQPDMDFTGQKRVDPLTLQVYPRPVPGVDSLDLYEDDGLSRDYEQGAYSITPIVQRRSGSGPRADLEIDIGPASGGFPEMLASRTVEVVIHGARLSPDGVLLGGEPLDAYTMPVQLDAVDSGYLLDQRSGQLRIRFMHHAARRSAVRVEGILLNLN
jgi:alpha-glucosidase (family GH31 glycosyl hydrolase)